MKVWVLQTGEPLQIDSGGLRPMRAINLSNTLVEHGHQVVLWSSDFDHFSKKHRTGKNSVIQYSPNLEIRLISSRGYKSHVGLSRLFDHAQLAFNLGRELKKQPLPDVAFIGYPPIETAWVIARKLKRHKIPFLIDVKDAWPEILVRAFPSYVKPITRILLSPYFLLMKQSFRICDGISAPTTEFLNWTLSQIKRKRRNTDVVTPLTSRILDVSEDDNLKAQIWWEQKLQPKRAIFRASFVGTFNSAFNFAPIIEAARSHPEYQFILAGEGPQLKDVKNRCETFSNVIFPGWINTSQARILYMNSDVVLAPLLDLPDFNMSIQNKFYDAMANGIPVVTSIKGVARKFIDENETGFLYENSPISSLSECLQKVEKNQKEKKKRAKNAKLIYQESFTFEKVYGDLVLHLEDMGKKKTF